MADKVPLSDLLDRTLPPFAKKKVGAAIQDFMESGLQYGVFTYKFARDGGAAGTKTLRASGTIPSGSIILGGVLEVIAQVTGSGASVALQAEAAGDVQASAAVSGAPWSTTGRKSIVPVFTGATSLKTTTNKAPKMVISGGDLTAGIFNLHLVWLAPAETAPTLDDL